MTGLYAAQGGRGWQEGVEVPKVGGTMDKGPEAGGAPGEILCV